MKSWNNRPPEKVLNKSGGLGFLLPKSPLNIMDNILIIDIDSRIPNLALKKVEKYHLDRGDTVTWNMPLMRWEADKIYVSCVFEWNRHKCKEWVGDANIGGSGWDLYKKLSPEIEAVKPRINLGFTTRGCIRNCEFCIVPKKEGRIEVVGDLLDLWDGKSKTIRILDNNIMALPEHFKMICQQARDNKIRLDFDGLDARLLNDDLCNELTTISHAEYRFAFDKISDRNSVERAIKLLKAHGIMQSTWYVLVGFDTTIEEDFERLNYLRDNGQAAFVQRYNYCKGKEYIQMARWANQHHIFKGMTWKQFCNHPENKSKTMARMVN